MDRTPFVRLGRLAWPVLIAQLATIGMMAIDTVVVGRSNTDNLAALAVGASIYVSLALALSGVVQALLPGVAHQIGRGDAAAAGKLIFQAFWLVLLLAVFGDLVLFFPGWMIALAELTPAVEALTRDYLFILAFSLPASLGYRAFHAIAGGVGQTRPLMWLSLGQTTGHALMAPVLVDSLTIGTLTLGVGLGASGAALSQAILAWLVCGAGVVVLCKSPVYRDLLKNARWSGPDWKSLVQLLRVGLPMGLSYFVEITAFTVMAIFIARLGPEVLSGHRIVANLSAMVYMFPLAIGTATAALVGQSAGADRDAEARVMARSAFWVACVGSGILAVLLWEFRSVLAWLGSPDENVQAVAIGLVGFVAAYQLFDAAQTVAAFALRGYHVTLLPLGIHLTAFWLIGLWGGYQLAFYGLPMLSIAPMGAAGFWSAVLGATVLAAIGLVGLLIWVQRLRRAPG